jgi:hypothetical protein
MFKFTIREAVLMTTIVALSIMLWMERKQNARNDARLAAIEAFFQSIPGSANYSRLPSVPPTMSEYGPITPVAPTVAR